MPQNIQQATTNEDREAVVCTLQLAFAADPFTRWVAERPETFVPMFRGFIEGSLVPGMDQGTVYVVRGEHAVHAASIWLPPGVAPDIAIQGAGFAENMTQAEMEAKMPAVAQMEQWHPDEPHWYLPIIGVDPTRQGKGHGSALLEHALRRVDEDGLPAYLESSNAANIPLYERFGFEVMGEIVGSETAKLWPMFRQAR